MNCRVTVIIATYNGLHYLVPCLRALAVQTFRAFQIVVVDDGSTDGTLATIRRDFPCVAIMRFAANRGLARAHNAAIAASDAEYIVLLNNDTEPEPEWLERLVAAADAHPEAWAVACKLRLWDRRAMLHAAGDGFGTDGLPRNLGVWEEDRGQWDDGHWLWGPQGGAALYRRAALTALSSAATGNPFDASFFMYCEDVDLNWRARLEGYTTAFAPNAVVYHHLSATGGGRLASYFVGRNTLAVLVKDVPAALLRRHWRAIVRAQLRITGESLRHIREPAARARLRGQIAIVPILTALLRARAAVQSRRVIYDAALARDLMPERP
ncbi:MAG: glycosyltransferase family 2 protein [Thermomicrobia bacterium]|nr:glycosyltransferase family 2 protein [Thermomicrobia bacterium]